MAYEPSLDELMFFDGKPTELRLYLSFMEDLLARFSDIGVRVQKTQITLTNPKVFACASFAKVRKAKERPGEYIVVSFGLGQRLCSPRIDAASEPYPGRWTNHVTLGQPDEINGELMGWVEEAYRFSKAK